MSIGSVVFPLVVQRVAVISLHTSPLAQPGGGDSGGMNVYVRELVSALAHAGMHCTTFTRRTRADQPDVIDIEPGHRVVHVTAGPFDLPKEQLPAIVDEFTNAVERFVRADGLPHVIHANYWLSGLVAHQLKHRLAVPFICTFHTLAKVKAEGGDAEPEWRQKAEHDIIACADAICVSCSEEESQFVRLYGTPQGTLDIVAPGVEHAFFAPGDRRGARRALDLPHDAPVLLFVGRIQPLKGPDVAIRALAEMAKPDALLLVVGGASGTEGDAEMAALQRLIDELDVRRQVRFVPPQPHHILSTYYRAADAVLVPSRSESFGLVALEASACGIPVVASAVGGLLTLVDHGETGYLVANRDPQMFARYCNEVLDHPAHAAALGRRAALRAQRYTWGFAAARLRRMYTDVGDRALVSCP
jgi:D-inositol-3-phosphate glycosyltransferase